MNQRDIVQVSTLYIYITKVFQEYYNDKEKHEKELIYVCNCTFCNAFRKFV